MAIHRQYENCIHCGEPLTPVFLDKGKDFVGDTFSGWYEPHTCKQPHPSTPAGKEVVNYQHRGSVTDIMVKFCEAWAEKDSPELLKEMVDFCMSLRPYPTKPSPQSEQAGEKVEYNDLHDWLVSQNLNTQVSNKFTWQEMTDILKRYAQSLPTEGRGVGWVKASNHGLPPIEVVTLEQLIEHGKNNGANIVNNMPWSFKYRNHPVTHENDGRYLVGCPSVDCTKDNPVIFFCNKVFNYWKNPGRLNILYKGLPDVLITGEGNWCFWSGRAVGHAGIDEYRGSHIRVKEEDLKFIVWLDEAPLLQEAAEWVSEAVEFAEFCADNFRRLATQWYPHYTTKYGAGNLTTAELYQLFIQQTRPAQTKQ